MSREHWEEGTSLYPEWAGCIIFFPLLHLCWAHKCGGVPHPQILCVSRSPPALNRHTFLYNSQQTLLHSCCSLPFRAIFLIKINFTLSILSWRQLLRGFPSLSLSSLSSFSFPAGRFNLLHSCIVVCVCVFAYLFVGCHFSHILLDTSLDNYKYNVRKYDPNVAICFENCAGLRFEKNLIIVLLSHLNLLRLLIYIYFFVFSLNYLIFHMFAQYCCNDFSFLYVGLTKAFFSIWVYLILLLFYSNSFSW